MSRPATGLASFLLASSLLLMGQSAADEVKERAEPGKAQ